MKKHIIRILMLLRKCSYPMDDRVRQEAKRNCSRCLSCHANLPRGAMATLAQNAWGEQIYHPTSVVN